MLLASLSAQAEFTATHYGASYQGSTLGCAGMGAYNTYDVTIVAVGPDYYNMYPCGTPILIEGPAGSIIGVRKDSCPGCTTQIDLSEAGITQVCGGLGSCRVRVSLLE